MQALIKGGYSHIIDEKVYVFKRSFEKMQMQRYSKIKSISYKVDLLIRKYDIHLITLMLKKHFKEKVE